MKPCDFVPSPRVVYIDQSCNNHMVSVNEEGNSVWRDRSGTTYSFTVGFQISDVRFKFLWHYLFIFQWSWLFVFKMKEPSFHTFDFECTCPRYSTEGHLWYKNVLVLVLLICDDWKDFRLSAAFDGRHSRRATDVKPAHSILSDRCPSIVIWRGTILLHHQACIVIDNRKIYFTQFFFFLP